VRPVTSMTRLPASHSTDANAALGFAQRLADITSKLLGDVLLAVILHGSLTFEDYVPGPSDIDLLAIVDRPLSDCEIESLTRTIAAERGSPQRGSADY
jgi:predicted nucleotidyltransferase